MTLYGVVAEDEAILTTVRALVARTVDNAQPTECRRLNGKADFLANFWHYIKEFQYRFPAMHKALAVCDADNDDPIQLEADLAGRAVRHLPGLPFPLVFHVIRREVETWLLVDGEAITAATGVNIVVPGGNIESDLVDAKEYLSRQLNKQSVPYTPAVAQRIADRIDPATVAGRCPGFVAFTSRVRNGALRVSEDH